MAALTRALQDRRDIPGERHRRFRRWRRHLTAQGSRADDDEETGRSNDPIHTVLLMRLTLDTLPSRCSVRLQPDACPAQNIASALSGNPVPPVTRTGAMVSMNSHRFSLAAISA